MAQSKVALSAIEVALSGLICSVVLRLQKAVDEYLGKLHGTTLPELRARSVEAWRSIPRDWFERDLLGVIEEYVSRHIPERVQSPRPLSSAFLLIHDVRKEELCYWVPDDEQMLNRLGPPYVLKPVYEGIADNEGNELIPSLSRLSILVKKFERESHGLGLALRLRDVVYLPVFEKDERSHKEFDAIAGFMSVLSIPIGEDPVLCITGYPYSGQLRGAVVLCSPLVECFGPAQGTPPQPKPSVLRRIISLLDEAAIGPILKLAQVALEEARRERQNSALLSAHRVPTRIDLVMLKLNALVAEVGGPENPSRLALLNDISLHLRGIQFQLRSALDDLLCDPSIVRRNFEHFDLASKLASYCDSQRLSAVGKKIVFTYELEPTPIHGSEDYLLLAFHNLIDNAIEAAGDSKWVGTRRVNLVMTIADQCLVQIENTGFGISPSAITGFRRAIATRGQETWTSKSYGSGLGLLVAYLVLREHEATYGPDSYQVDSNGSTILSFELPIEKGTKAT